MTPVQTRANGFGTPSLPQLLLTAMLRVLVELVLNIASTFQMSRLRPMRDWHMPDDEAALPRVKTDTIKETHAAQHRSPIALMVSSTRSVRPSNHEGVLTAVSHTLQQREHPIHHAALSLRSSRRKSGTRATRVMLATELHVQSWIPTFVVMSGARQAAPL